MIPRRRFLLGMGAAVAALPFGRAAARTVLDSDAPWHTLRRGLDLDPDYVHLAGLLISPHRGALAGCIADFGVHLDRNPVLYLDEHNQVLEGVVRTAAARYLGTHAGDIALTDSTTMGIGLVYNGIRIRPDQELLTTTHDYYATVTALRYRAARSGARLRRVEPFADPYRATAGEMTDRLLDAIRPETRVLALTWVHSWTGVKMPVRSIADGLRGINADRDPEDRVLLCLDGVHGLGVEDEALPALGCDFFMAGTHKWLFGPRGTGILWGRPETQEAVQPTIPTFSIEPGWGGVMSPGGFKAFEHRWALAAAFDFHGELGRERVRTRIHDLARRCKEGLDAMAHVRLRTPLDPAVSAGIVSFDVTGRHADEVIAHLARHRIIGSVTPYDPPHARLSPGLHNTEGDIDDALRAIEGLA